MDISAFNPQAFLDATITEPTVKRPPIPVGDYTAVIGEVTSRQWQGVKDPSKTGIALDIPLVVDVPAEIQAAVGLKQPTITLKDSIMLDLTESGTIDNSPGRNTGLRRYREACDMNKPGDSFSVRLMQGHVVKVKIAHEIYQDAPVERVSGVTR